MNQGWAVIVHRVIASRPTTPPPRGPQVSPKRQPTGPTRQPDRSGSPSEFFDIHCCCERCLPRHRAGIRTIPEPGDQTGGRKEIGSFAGSSADSHHAHASETLTDCKQRAPAVSGNPPDDLVSAVSTSCPSVVVAVRRCNRRVRIATGSRGSATRQCANKTTLRTCRSHRCCTKCFRDSQSDRRQRDLS